MPENKRKPIVVNDKNDPRLKAYNDSLAGYLLSKDYPLLDKKYQKELRNFDANTHLHSSGMATMNGYNVGNGTSPYEIAQKALNDKAEAMNKFREKTGLINSELTDNQYMLYKKPVQPVILENKPKLEPIKPLGIKPMDTSVEPKLAGNVIVPEIPSSKNNIQNYTGSKALQIQGKPSGYINEGNNTGRQEFRKGGWLDGLDNNKTEQAPDVTNAKEYVKGWYNSPMYDNILRNQNIDLGITNPNRLERRVKQHKKYYNESNYNVTPSVVENLKNYGEGYIDNKGNKQINLNKNFVQNNPKLVNSLYAHELTHDNLMTVKDREYINKNTPEYNPALHKEDTYNKLTDPEEVRSQIHSIRQLSGENKIYDPLTQPFKKEYLDKVNKSYNQGTKESEDYNQLNRLRKYYSDDQITDMMNTITKSNSNDGKVYAKNGGWLDGLTTNKFDMGGLLDGLDKGTQVPDATATAKPVVNLNFAVTPAQKQVAAKNKRQAEVDMQVDHPEFYTNPNFLDKKAVKPYSVKDYKKGIKEPGLQTSMDPIDLVGTGVYKGLAKALGAKEVAVAADAALFNSLDKSKVLYNQLKIKAKDDIYKLKYRKDIASLESKKFNAMQKMNNPEGWKRLREQGVEPKQFFDQLNKSKITSTRNAGSWDNGAQINIDFDQVKRLQKEGYDLSVENILDHEIGHRMQRGFNSKAVNDYNQAKSYNYRNQVPKQFVYSTPLDKEAELLLSPVIKNPNKNSDYFLFGSDNKERLPFLREAKESMVSKGFIDNIYSKITPETMKKFLKEVPSNRFSTFLDIENPITHRRLSGLLNKTPIVAGVGLGVNELTKDKKSNTGWLDNLK
jgi:hypothetical protein